LSKALSILPRTHTRGPPAQAKRTSEGKSSAKASDGSNAANKEAAAKNSRDGFMMFPVRIERKHTVGNKNGNQK
jgi:hypothetical protein